LISITFISSYNTTRSKSVRELGVFDKIGIIIAHPAVFLNLPLFYVSDKVFTDETTTREIMKKSGMTNDPPLSDALDTPITHPTSSGFAVGLIVEMLFLYCFACLFSLLKDYMRSRV